MFRLSSGWSPFPTQHNYIILRWSLNLLFCFFIQHGSNQTFCCIHSCCCSHRTNCCSTFFWVQISTLLLRNDITPAITPTPAPITPVPIIHPASVTPNTNYVQRVVFWRRVWSSFITPFTRFVTPSTRVGLGRAAPCFRLEVSFVIRLMIHYPWLYICTRWDRAPSYDRLTSTSAATSLDGMTPQQAATHREIAQLVPSKKKKKNAGDLPVPAPVPVKLENPRRHSYAGDLPVPAPVPVKLEKPRRHSL